MNKIIYSLLIFYLAGCKPKDTSSVENGETGGQENYYVCGNQMKNPGEDCDGVFPIVEMCEDFGYERGEIKCNKDCTFDFSSCYPSDCIVPPC